MTSTRSLKRHAPLIMEEPIVKEEIEDPAFEEQEPTSFSAHLLLEEEPELSHLIKEEDDTLEQPIKEELDDWNQQPSTSYPGFTDHNEAIGMSHVAKDEEGSIKEELDYDYQDSPHSFEDCEEDTEDSDAMEQESTVKKGSNSAKRFQCKICKGVYSSAASLKTHHRLHTGELPYICEVCNEGFRYKDSLIRHTRTHTKDKGLQCGVCKKYYVDLICLRRHMMSHIKVLPFACDICGKSYTLRDRLTRHKKVHDEKKKKPQEENQVFKCDQCGQVFPSRGSLTRHGQVHSEEKYNCTTCGKFFTSKHYLAKHVSLKTCGKPQSEIHKCTICYELTINFGPMLKHYKEVHGIDPKKAWKMHNLKTE